MKCAYSNTINPAHGQDVRELDLWCYISLIILLSLQRSKLHSLYMLSSCLQLGALTHKELASGYILVKVSGLGF